MSWRRLAGRSERVFPPWVECGSPRAVYADTDHRRW